LELPDSVPTWKESLVERVRRRTAETRVRPHHQAGRGSRASSAGAHPPTSSAFGGASGSPRPVSARSSTSSHGRSEPSSGSQSARASSASGRRYARGKEEEDAEDSIAPPAVSDDIWASPAPVATAAEPQDKGMSRLMQLSRPSRATIEEDEEDEEESEESMARRLEHEAFVRQKHALATRYRDQNSDLVLARQFLDADCVRLWSEIEKKIKIQQAAGGNGGRLNAAKQKGGEYDQMQEAKRLTAKLSLYESRASDANNVNKNLEIIINELRRERAEQLSMERAKTSREGLMTTDMRAYSSAAHSALDEKERIKSRLRRMRHEWRMEKGAAEAEAGALIVAEEELDRLISQMEADEEKWIQADKRREARHKRDVYALKDRLGLRSGFQQSQLAGLVGEFKLLGEVAGLLSKGTAVFAANDPSSATALIATMKQNDQRNESEHAFLQSIDTDLDELALEVASLEAEEEALRERERESNLNREVALAKAAEVAISEAKFEALFGALETALSALQPQLTATTRRLYQSYSSTLEDAPVPILSPIPVRHVPKGLEPGGDQPVHLAIEDELHKVDALMQLMSSRVTRLMVARQGDESFASAHADGSHSPLHPHLRMFTELPPEFTVAELKAARAELELTASKQKEENEA